MDSLLTFIIEMNIVYIDKINLFRYTKGFGISCMGEPGAEIYWDGVPGVFASPYHCGYVF